MPEKVVQLRPPSALVDRCFAVRTHSLNRVVATSGPASPPGMLPWLRYGSTDVKAASWDQTRPSSCDHSIAFRSVPMPGPPPLHSNHQPDLPVDCAAAI